MLIQAKLERYKEMKFKTKIILSTNEEIDPVLFEQNKGPGFLLFSPDEIKKSVEEAMKNRHLGMEYKGKTRSQVLRGVLWHLAAQEGEPGELYYDEKMEEIINHFKSKINGY